MLKRLSLGFVAGYVVGARAGHDRYEQIEHLAQRMMQNQSVQERFDSLRSAAGDGASHLKGVVGGVRRGGSPEATGGSPADGTSDGNNGRTAKARPERAGSQKPDDASARGREVGSAGPPRSRAGNPQEGDRSANGGDRSATARDRSANGGDRETPRQRASAGAEGPGAGAAGRHETPSAAGGGNDGGSLRSAVQHLAGAARERGRVG
jgi:hypothetical protein